jgi:hypothetical protein
MLYLLFGRFNFVYSSSRELTITCDASRPKGAKLVFLGRKIPEREIREIPERQSFDGVVYSVSQGRIKPMRMA